MSPITTTLLDRVRYPADLRNFSIDQLRELADELRAESSPRLPSDRAQSARDL